MILILRIDFTSKAYGIIPSCLYIASIHSLCVSATELGSYHCQWLICYVYHLNSILFVVWMSEQTLSINCQSQAQANPFTNIKVSKAWLHPCGWCQTRLRPESVISKLGWDQKGWFMWANFIFNGGKWVKRRV